VGSNVGPMVQKRRARANPILHLMSIQCPLQAIPFSGKVHAPLLFSVTSEAMCLAL